MRNVYNHAPVQLIYGLFQVFALFGLPRVRTVLQQAQNRSRSRPAQERIKQGTEDEKLPVSIVLSCNQGIVGIIRYMEDS